MKKIQSSKWYMRITILFLFIIPLSVSAAQEKVSIKKKAITVKEAINVIEKSSTYSFFFKSTDLDNKKRRDVDCEGTLDEVLSEVLKGSNIKYVIKGKDVILSVNGVQNTAPQQSKKNEIIGMVVDYQTGDPVIGATIQVKGASTGVISDIDGKFKVNASPNDILMISYIGYQTMERKVGKQKLINIELKEDSKALDEVVVTAFGVGQKKESLVGSVQQIKPAELKVPSSSLSSSFAGRLAGVIAVQRTGEPGADGSNFWIRGKSTFSGATAALIILDGVEISSSDLNALDPEVIEGFSILKDATATALYGTRGANGVMIVTTKRGEDVLKPIINIRLEGSVQQMTDVPSMVGGVEYMKMYNEAILTRGGSTDLYSQDKIDKTAAGLNPLIYPNTNWYDEMFNKLALSERANLNIRGGRKTVKYFMSVAVKRDGGNLKSISKDYFSYNNNINVIRYDFVNNLDIDATKTTKVSLGLNASIRDWNGPKKDAADIFNSSRTASPVDFPIIYPEWSDNEPHYHWGNKSGGAVNGGYPNPIADYVTGYRTVFTSTVQASLRLEQDLSTLVKGLKLKGLASFKNWSKTQVSRTANYNRYEVSKINDDGTYELSRVGAEQGTGLTSEFKESTGDRRIYLQAYLDYNRRFGEHDINAMFLYNQDEYAVNNPSDLYSSLARRKQGIAGRFSYGYDNKYLAEVNFGYNGSENFAKGNRWGFFPSFAVGYNISQEKFFQPLSKAITHLKLRASWGLVGNDDIRNGNAQARFAYMDDILLASSPQYNTGYDQGTGLKGPLWIRYYDPELKWEVGEKLNVGMDLQLYNDFNLHIDAFKETRRDIFMKRDNTIPTFLGTNTFVDKKGTVVFGNVGKMKNVGVDVAIDYNKQINKDFFMSAKGTFTYAHNTILAKDEPPFTQYPNLISSGHSSDVNLLYVADGLFTQEEIDSPDMIPQTLGYTPQAGDIKYKDITGDGVIDTNDRIYTGNPSTPEIIYGFGASMKYKKWDFSFFFQGVAKTSLLMNGFHPFGDNATNGVMDFIAENRWTEDNQNPNAEYPRLTRASNQNNIANSTFWLRNGSFLKLKNAEVGYTHKFLRVYLSGANLLTFSPFKYWDPEMGGGSGLKYPTMRTFNIGVQLTFK